MVQVNTIYSIYMYRLRGGVYLWSLYILEKCRNSEFQIIRCSHFSRIMTGSSGIVKVLQPVPFEQKKAFSSVSNTFDTLPRFRCSKFRTADR